ncbi:hypothetical protein EDD11_000086 [Mortierella claussenii]|nr:hypothetical protein EDD11_000086 [Mortierella claussenii]
MSHYNQSYTSNSASNSARQGQYDTSATYRQRQQLQFDDNSCSQQQQQFVAGEEQHNEKEGYHQQQDSLKPKKRTLNPAKAVVGGISQGTQAVRGGISTIEKGVTTVGTNLNKVPGVSQGVSYFSDYRKFMDRGNVIDLAVAVIIGAAFTAIVTSLVTDIITPVIALASGKNLEENFLILRSSHNATAGIPTTRLAAKEAGNITWNWGNFVQTVINFFIVSGCVFLFVKLYQVARNKKVDVTEKKCDYCTKSIPLEAVRCPNCTTWLDWDACARVANMERLTATSPPMVAATVPAMASGTSYNGQGTSLGRF